MAIKLRVELLVPLRYNNGRDVEHKKLSGVTDMIVNKFGAITTYPLSTGGVWIDPRTSKRYYDICRRFEVLINKKENSEMELFELKEELIRKFDQKDIFMIYTEVVQI